MDPGALFYSEAGTGQIRGEVTVMAGEKSTDLSNLQIPANCRTVQFANRDRPISALDFALSVTRWVLGKLNPLCILVAEPGGEGGHQTHV